MGPQEPVGTRAEESAEVSCGRQSGEHRRPLGGDKGPARISGMGADVPGLVWGSLIWDNPEFSSLDDASEHWTPIH